jgi:hypothetical protein
MGQRGAVAKGVIMLRRRRFLTGPHEESSQAGEKSQRFQPIADMIPLPLRERVASRSEVG